MKARLATVVGGIQRLEAQQRTRGLAEGRRLGGGDAGQPGLGQVAELAHVQTQGRLSAQGDGGVAQVHVARNRQARPGFGQAPIIQPITQQQWLRIVAELAERFGQGLDEAYRQLAQAHALTGHGVTATG